MGSMIEFCKERAVDAMEHFLCVLSFVPAERVNWSPAPTAKSALQIAAHCAGYSGAFASVIQAYRFPDSVEAFRGPIESTINSITTLEQAERVLRKGIADTVAALDSVTPEQIGGRIATPQGQTPFTFFMDIPARHLFAHTAQIDYLQTCWDDQVVHF